VILLLFSVACPYPGQAGELNLWDWDRYWVRFPSPECELAGGGIQFGPDPEGQGRVAVFSGSTVNPGIIKTVNLPLQPEIAYELSFELLRPKSVNGEYLSLIFFGQETWLDNHRLTKKWQAFRVVGRLKDGDPGRVVFRNDTPSRFLLRRVSLKPIEVPQEVGEAGEPALVSGQKFFPIGAYGTEADLAEMAACGLNTAVVGASPEKAASLLLSARGLGMRLILHCPSQPEEALELARALTSTPPQARPLYFYVADEPELRSLDPAALATVRESLRSEIPWAATATAMVRPRFVSEYGPAYDAFFMDQYPVPGQPLTWLADSIAQARQEAGHGRQVWAVVQAFGGGRLAPYGWTRRPSFEEMQALACSALAEGVGGLLFCNWAATRQNPSHQANLCRLVGRLQGLRDWLPLQPGLGERMGFELLGKIRCDPGGGAALRVGHRIKGKKVLILVANVTPYPLRVSLTGLKPPFGRAKDLWEQKDKGVVAGQLRERLEPLGIRAWLIELASNEKR